MRTIWYKRSGKRVSIKRVQKFLIEAIHAKRFGYPKSPHAVPGMSAQPTIADAYAKMTLKEFASYSGVFTWRDVE